MVTNNAVKWFYCTHYNGYFWLCENYSSNYKNNLYSINHFFPAFRAIFMVYLIAVIIVRFMPKETILIQSYLTFRIFTFRALPQDRFFG